MMGMRYVDWEEYQRLRDDLALRQGTVVVHSGCVITRETCESAVLSMEAMYYSDDQLRTDEVNRLRSHFETLRKQKTEQTKQTPEPENEGRSS